MTGVDTAEWPSCELTTCADCGQPLLPRQDAGGGRFYGCGCPELVDADDLDEMVAQAVLEQLKQRLARQSFSPRRVRAVWHNANATTRRAIIGTELAAVTISREDGQLHLAYVWNTERPDTRTAR